MGKGGHGSGEAMSCNAYSTQKEQEKVSGE